MCPESSDEEDFLDNTNTESVEESKEESKEVKEDEEKEVEETEEERERIFQVPRETIEEALLYEEQLAERLEFQEAIRARREALERALWEEQLAEREAVEEVQRREAARLEAFRQLDIQVQRAIAEMSDEYLTTLHREHAQRTQMGEKILQRDAAAEAQRRQQAAEKERLERAKAAVQAEQARKLAEEKRILEEKKKADEMARLAAEQQKKAAEDQKKAQELQKAQAKANNNQTTNPGNVGMANRGSKPGPKPRVAEGAAKDELLRLQKLKEVETAVQPLINDSLKKDRRTLRRKINLIVQQISASESQIRTKTNELMQLLMDPSMPQQLVALWLAEKFLLQCQAQSRELSFCLAQVIVDVSTKVPLVMELTLAQLNQVCIYTVPKYYVYNKDHYPVEEDYFKKIGYEEVDGKLESTDAYVSRMTRYVALFAAIVQTDSINGVHPYGLREGWAWFARILNKIPANRISAAMLRTFLEIAGYRLYREYPRPVLKVITAVHQEFLPLLASQNDSDAAGEFNNLETYIVLRLCAKEPEGRKIPKTDESSTTRA